MGDSVPELTHRYRIGVDVGGTNTDAALVCRTITTADDQIDAKNIEVVASSKSKTTADVTTGICNSIRNVLSQVRISTSDILSVNIGTTHFINAVTQCDSKRLRRVAVLRLCGPFGREVRPFSDWPSALRTLLKGPVGYLSGGLELDGRVISEVSAEEVRRHANIIKGSNITAVVVIGIFSVLDHASPTQEEFVKKVLLEQIPELDVVCSRDIGNAPFIERENAAILNASILDFGRTTIGSFRDAFRALDLNCSLYLTQNDGTVMDVDTAMRLPIKTFSSGATNSLTGAMFLSGIHGRQSEIDPKASQVIMVDIGGTTSDFAALAPSGFPRQSPATVKVGGVRTAFQSPELVSIGLGGGSHVSQHEDGRVSVGPTSVGFQLSTLSRCFGGEILTASDIVAASYCSQEFNPTTKVEVSAELVSKARLNIKKQLERHIEQMRVSDQDVTLLLVGGGSIIQMDQFDNVKTCIRPPFYNVANAVGAAIAKISGEVDQIEIAGDANSDDIVERLKINAIDRACANGATRETVKIVEVDCIPLQYTTNKAIRVVIRACGELKWEHSKHRNEDQLETSEHGILLSTQLAPKEEQIPGTKLSEQDADLSIYVPDVSKASGEWFLSETDLAFIAEGCGVLGTGGGGSVHSAYLHSVDVLKSLPRGRMRVVDPMAIKDGSRVGIAAGVGAPTVTDERLGGDKEFVIACEKLLKYLQLDSFAALASGEIGGANGMCPIPVAAAMDIPILDVDLMGRAFPKVDMCLPLVYGVEKACPAVLADPRGTSQIITDVDTAERLERLLRCVCIELGLSCALAFSFSIETMKKYSCHQSLSLCWYAGRAIALARQQRRDIIEALTEVIPGCRSIFTGRIINIRREVKGGWTIGTVTIEPGSEDNDFDSNEADTHVETDSMIVQYQNEFLYAAYIRPDGSLDTLCTTPDLITILDASGTALGTHELRYGLMVSVIAMPSHPLWKSPLGMKASDPASFGIDLAYKPFGLDWEKPLSVIQEFGR